jgi:hypothetical protein
MRIPSSLARPSFKKSGALVPLKMSNLDDIYKLDLDGRFQFKVEGDKILYLDAITKALLDPKQVSQMAKMEAFIRMKDNDFESDFIIDKNNEASIREAVTAILKKSNTQYNAYQLQNKKDKLMDELMKFAKLSAVNEILKDSIEPKTDSIEPKTEEYNPYSQPQTSAAGQTYEKKGSYDPNKFGFNASE